MRDLITLAQYAARRAGAAMMPHYGHANPELKGDGSPVTDADRAADYVIREVLSISGLPIVSEEGDELKLDAVRYWLVDPLDGTKDFLACNDEFTVNIALVDDRRPQFGVVLAPAIDELFCGGAGIGAKCVKDNVTSVVVPRRRTKRCRMAVSRFHEHPDVQLFATSNQIAKAIPMGSALKYVRLAMSKAEVYPRLVGSSEWDSAAGQAILEGVGGQVLEWGTGLPLRYGKPRRRNPRLISMRAPYGYTDFILQPFETDIE